MDMLARPPQTEPSATRSQTALPEGQVAAGLVLGTLLRLVLHLVTPPGPATAEALKTNSSLLGGARNPWLSPSFWPKTRRSRTCHPAAGPTEIHKPVPVAVKGTGQTRGGHSCPRRHLLQDQLPAPEVPSGEPQSSQPPYREGAGPAYLRVLRGHPRCRTPASRQPGPPGFSGRWEVCLQPARGRPKPGREAVLPGDWAQPRRPGRGACAGWSGLAPGGYLLIGSSRGREAGAEGRGSCWLSDLP